MNDNNRPHNAIGDMFYNPCIHTMDTIIKLDMNPQEIAFLDKLVRQSCLLLRRDAESVRGADSARRREGHQARFPVRREATRRADEVR